MKGINRYSRSIIHVYILFVLSYIVQKETIVEASNDILIVGDDVGENMGQTLESLCERSSVYNAAKSASTADEWARFTPDDLGDCKNGNWNTVYISVGMNDLLESGCTLTADKLATKVLSAVTNIIGKVAPRSEKYLVHGSCIPSMKGFQTTYGCTVSDQFAVWKKAYSLIEKRLPLVRPKVVKVINSSEICGGSQEEFSNGKYFEDNLNLNSRGYCTVFTQPDIQNYLSCGEIQHDCDDTPPSITGVGKKCRSEVDVRKACKDDSTWKTTRGKSCAWVARKRNERCNRRVNKIPAYDACPIVCGNTSCAVPNCGVNRDWRATISKKGKDKEVNCNYVKKRPFKGCAAVGSNGVFGYEACCRFCEDIV